MDGWVVTPRRGKAVEINALWYNALRVMEEWARDDNDRAAADQYAESAARVRSHSTNGSGVRNAASFWTSRTGKG